MDPAPVNVQVGDNNQNLAITVNAGGGPSALLDAVVREMAEDIDRYSLEVRYQQMLVQAEKVLRTVDLNTMLDLVDCRRKHCTAEQKIRALLSFLINAMLIDDQLTTPNSATMGTIVKGEPCWVFQTPRGEPEPLAMHLADLLQLFQKVPDCEVRNGTAFLARLRDAPACEQCIGQEQDTSCVRGVLTDWMLGGCSAVFGRPERITDYFTQLAPRNLVVKCGNCMVDVQRTEDARKLYEGR